MLNILVVGGAGFIGSHLVKKLGQLGWQITTLDNLSSGHRDAVLTGEFVHGDIADQTLLDQLFASRNFDSVMHFASFIQAGESVMQPSKYYANNLSNTLNLLNTMVRHEVKQFIFSSTAAIFGEPQYVPIDEKHPIMPINPYGASKAMVERVLQDYDKAYGLKSVCLRYFNACGADPDGELGERHQPETHLIPLILQAISGRSGPITLFGRDYNTPDGTCIRDYVHVADLCQAHVRALEWLKEHGASAAFNLGNGSGFSVIEVINASEKVTDQKVPIIEGHRRAGDAARLVSDSTLARRELGWQPEYSNLHEIISHAWSWELKMTNSPML